VVQQYLCKRCGRQRAKLPDSSWTLVSLPGLRISVVTVLKATAMFALGLPMERIEKRLGLKAETIRSYLLRLAESAGWVQVRALLILKTRISARDLEELDLLTVERAFDDQLFRRRAQEFRRLTPSKRRKIECRCLRIAALRIRL